MGSTVIPVPQVDPGPARRAWISPGRFVFVVWLVAVYAAWLAFVINLGLWDTVRAHWPISMAMMFGSFVGGSSPISGGSVGFPVLVYVFNNPARLGRDFSLAIQSIGLVSASIYALTRGRAIEWRILRYSLPGAALAMPLGIFVLAPRAEDTTIKLLFALLYASFGLFHLVRLSEIVACEGASRSQITASSGVAFAAGVAGGLLASIIGVGADILLYGTLVLLFRSDIKVAIPTAIIQMAFTSLVGVACLTFGTLDGRVGFSSMVNIVPYLLAAAPVVVLGAPLGSFVSSRVPRRWILRVVAALCFAQFAFTCAHQHVVGWSLVLALAAVLAVNLILHALFEIGRQSLVPGD